MKRRNGRAVSCFVRYECQQRLNKHFAPEILLHHPYPSHPPRLRFLLREVFSIIRNCKPVDSAEGNGRDVQHLGTKHTLHEALLPSRLSGKQLQQK